LVVDRRERRSDWGGYCNAKKRNGIQLSLRKPVEDIAARSSLLRRLNHAAVSLRHPNGTLSAPAAFLNRSPSRRVVGEHDGIGAKRVPNEVSEGLWASSGGGRRGRRGHGGTAIGHSCRTGVKTRSALSGNRLLARVHLESY
jgi:hypothetical protein